jgi:hypothetical protein
MLGPFQAGETLNQWQAELLGCLICEDEDPVLLTRSDCCGKRLFEVLRHHDFLRVHLMVMVYVFKNPDAKVILFFQKKGKIGKKICHRLNFPVFGGSNQLKLAFLE